MTYKRMEISDVILCEPKINNDIRGVVYESYKNESINSFLGFNVDFCQDNVSINKYGVIRGLHTNSLKFAQSKLVSVLKGEILDVALDFRVGSPTYGKYISYVLNDQNKRQLFIPKGFLHGFSVLADETVINIKIDGYFAPGESIGIKYDDESLGIDWKLDKKDLILSENDSKLNNFNEVLSPFKYNEILY